MWGFFFFFWMIKGIRAHCEPPPPVSACLPAFGGLQELAIFLPDGLQRRKRAVQSFSKGDMTVQRDARSLMSPPASPPPPSCLAHGRTTIHIFSTWAASYLRVQCSPCRPSAPKTPHGWLNGASCFFGRGLF